MEEEKTNEIKVLSYSFSAYLIDGELSPSSSFGNMSDFCKKKLFQELDKFIVIESKDSDDGAIKTVTASLKIATKTK